MALSTMTLSILVLIVTLAINGSDHNDPKPNGLKCYTHHK
jgi:hypothetical protein